MRTQDKARGEEGAEEVDKDSETLEEQVEHRRGPVSMNHLRRQPV
jgi:hypothetical protein